MAIRIRENEVTVKYAENIGKGQLAAECVIDASSGGVGKVYCVSGDCVVKSVQAQDKAVQVVCEVSTRVIYADGSGALASADYVTAIDRTLAVEGATAQMRVIARASVSDIRHEIVGQTIKVQTVTDLDFEGDCEYTVSLIEEAEGAITRECEQELMLLKGGGSDSFVVTEEFESGCKIGKILDYGAQVGISSWRAEEGGVYVEGEVWIRLVYDDDGICSKQFSHPFAEELMIGGACADDVVTINAAVQSVSILITGSEEENVVQMDVTVGAEVNLFEKSVIKAVTDVFSPSAEIDVVRAEKQFAVPVGSRYVSKRICANAESESESPIRRCLAAIPSGVSGNVFCSDGKLVAEGVAAVCEIYEKDDGEISSVCVEIPFSFTSELKEDVDLVRASMTVSDIVSRVRRESEIEVCVSLSVSADLYENRKLCGITHMEISQEKTAELCGISVYTVEEGETLWDVAKAVCLSEKEIIAQNEGVEKGLRAGERITVFRCMEE